MKLSFHPNRGQFMILDRDDTRRNLALGLGGVTFLQRGFPTPISLASPPGPIDSQLPFWQSWHIHSIHQGPRK